jgi:hypothetical protein
MDCLPSLSLAEIDLEGCSFMDSSNSFSFAFRPFSVASPFSREKVGEVLLLRVCYESPHLGPLPFPKGGGFRTSRTPSLLGLCEPRDIVDPPKTWSPAFTSNSALSGKYNSVREPKRIIRTGHLFQFVSDLRPRHDASRNCSVSGAPQS